MKRAHIVAVLGGLVLAAALIVYFGADAVGRAISAAGWRGLAVICLAHVASLILCALAWRMVLLVPLARANLVLLWARYVRDSVGNLIGLIPATGEIAAARELTLAGVRPVVAAASTIVDMTAELLSQVLFTVAGLAVILARGVDGPVSSALIAGIGLAAVAVLGFLYAQQRGLFRFIETLPERLGFSEAWGTFSDEGTLHVAVVAIHTETWRLPASTLLHLLAWGFAALETYLALRLMGYAVTLPEALALESLVFAARTAAFIVPWAAGIQEGGYVLIGGLLGLPASASLALSVLKRAREVVFGAPGLIAWQLAESRRFARARSGGLGR